MSTIILQETIYHERSDDAFCFGSHYNSKFIFPDESPDSKERNLKLKFYQTQVDVSNDSLENLLMPLQVVLIEDDGRTVYEDVYHFSHEGDFFNHGWRKKPYANGEYEKESFTFDSDITKLYRYGEQIAEMMQGKIMAPALENHPTVRRLKTHTLWE